MIADNVEEALEFDPKGRPDVDALSQAYKETRSDLGEFMDQRQDDFDQRFQIWPGKSRDNRKHSRAGGGEPFPWEGASDLSCHLIDDVIRSHVSMLMSVMKRANLVATPVESDDVGRASVVQNFMKWMIHVKMENVMREFERGFNHLLEKGIMVHYVYWEQKDQKVLETIDLQEIVNQVPELGEMLLDEANDETLGELFANQYGVSERKARAMLRELRSEGSATIPVTATVHNRPAMKALACDGEIYWPSWTMDPQEAPYVFLAVHYTAEQLRSKVSTNDWNEEWVDHVIETVRGMNAEEEVNFSRERHRTSNVSRDLGDDETIRCIYAFQRLMDEDGVSGIYCTVFHPDVTGEHEMKKPWAKHELLPYRHGDYPFVVTKLEEWSKRLYETRSYPEIGKSWEQQLKAEMDAAVDRLSLSTLPPLEHPVGRAPSKWGPGVKVPYRTPGEYRYSDVPRWDGSSVEMRENVRRMTFEYFGRNHSEGDQQDVTSKQQALVEKCFGHVKEVMDQVWSLYQQYGSDSEYYRVIGVNDVQRFDKGEAGERYDFYLQFDVGLLDSGQIVERVKAISEMVGALDKNGVVDTEQLLSMVVEQALPGAADKIIQPRETAINRAVEEERSTISELVAGVPPNVKPNDAHQTKLQVFQQWMQQPDVQQKIQSDEALQQRVQNYFQQRNFHIQQAQNAQIGRMGAQPTQFGQTASASGAPAAPAASY